MIQGLPVCEPRFNGDFIERCAMEGVLTMDHPASSYGLPVYVRSGESVALGTDEVGELTVLVDSIEIPGWGVLYEAAVRAGYQITVVDPNTAQ